MQEIRPTCGPDAVQRSLRREMSGLSVFTPEDWFLQSPTSIVDDQIPQPTSHLIIHLILYLILHPEYTLWRLQLLYLEPLDPSKRT